MWQKVVHCVNPLFYVLGVGAVTISDFHYTIIVAKRIHNNDIITISTEYLQIQNN